jgi:hypothetical protein
MYTYTAAIKTQILYAVLSMSRFNNPEGAVIYFPKAGTYQSIEEFLTAKANKANKDVGSYSSFLPFAPQTSGLTSPLRLVFSSEFL